MSLHTCELFSTFCRPQMPSSNGTDCSKTPYDHWCGGKEETRHSHFMLPPCKGQRKGKSTTTLNLATSPIPRPSSIYSAAGVNCIRPVSVSFCKPCEVLYLAAELCPQPKTSSLEREEGKEKRKRKLQVKRLITVLNYRGLLIFH